MYFEQNKTNKPLKIAQKRGKYIGFLTKPMHKLACKSTPKMNKRVESNY
jgi:hypothetical protein